MRAREHNDSIAAGGRQATLVEATILEGVQEEEEDEEEGQMGESTPALEAARKQAAHVVQTNDELVAEAKYSSKVQFRAPDIIEL